MSIEIQRPIDGSDLTDFAGARDSSRCGDLDGGDTTIGAEDSDFRGLFGASKHRGGVWRKSGAGRAVDAREDVPDPA